MQIKNILKVIVIYIVFELIFYFIFKQINILHPYKYNEWAKYFYTHNKTIIIYHYLFFIFTTTLFFSLLYIYKNFSNTTLSSSFIKIPNYIKTFSTKIIINIPIIIFITAVIIQSTFYIKHITTNFKLPNEYKYIDEKTILKNGKIVSNNEYINNNLDFPDLSMKYSSKDLYFPKNSTHTFHKIPKYTYLSSNNKKNPLDIDPNYDSILKFKIYEIDNNGMSLKDIPLFTANSEEKLKEKYHFYKVNIPEQQFQILDRYYFHENCFMLNPINKFKNNIPYKNIFSQYGFLSIISINTAINLIGEFNINNFEKVMKSFHLLYFIIFIIFALIFFENKLLKLGAILIYGISFYKIGYYSFLYAPGIVPIRHIFDITIITMIFLYERKGKNIFIITAACLSVLSILISKDFGQYMFLSFVGMYTLKLTLDIFQKNQIKNKIILNKNKIIILLGTITLGITSTIFYPLKKNPSLKYFLDGFYSFPVKWLIFIILFFIAIHWIFLILFNKRLEEKKYLYSYIFLIIYSELILTYFVWGGFNHIIILLPIICLPLMVIYQIMDFKHKTVTSAMIIMLLSGIYIVLLLNFKEEIIIYKNIFKTHKTYKWNFKGAGGITSTIDPIYFEDSIKLIKKHNPSKKLYMISKYDNVLSLFTDKYSDLDHFELRSSIVTNNEYKKVLSDISQKADILFVDNDINRDFDLELKKFNIYAISEYWKGESVKQRIPKLKILKKLYKEVIDRYKLIEKGKLISIYKKIK